MPRYRVSIDIGGTFTDLVALNEADGRLRSFKVPSTPRNPSEAVMTVFKELLEEVDPGSISTVTHATTIAVNSLLGQLGLELPRTALITTKGFRDVLAIGRQRRSELYNLFIQKPRTLIPRSLRYEVDERIDPKGTVIKSLDISMVQKIATELRHKQVKALAVTLLHSYANPKHEQQIKTLLQKTSPSILVTCSSEIAPEYREFERTSTAAVNACLMPIISCYLCDLARRMLEIGLSAQLVVLQSDGGVSSPNEMMNRPASLIESGPAAGVIASAFYSTLLEFKNMISFDMGGTTAKAGIVQEGVPAVVTEYEVAGKVHSGRIVKGSGYPVKLPFIDLAECSAGGGTIAWVDEGSSLRVGPMSAGANPGPVCYQKGGKRPTVTDANLILGRLNSNYLLGGRMKVYPLPSKKALIKQICRKTNLGLVEAAAGIVQIVNATMAKILRIVSTERGHDPRCFVLNAFGGAGPMHACALAEELHISDIVVPPHPGLLSALGLLTADFRHSLSRAVMMTAHDIKSSTIKALFTRLQATGRQALKSQGIQPHAIKFQQLLDMRYAGQGYELTVPLTSSSRSEAFEKAIARFHDRHEAIYGYAAREESVELVNARLVAIGIVAKPKLAKQKLQGTTPPTNALLTKRQVYFEKEKDYDECPVYRRECLKPGNVVYGPAVIEQYDSTTIVYPGWDSRVDGYGNLLITSIGAGMIDA